MRLQRHSLFERGFLRDCAFFRCWMPRASDYSIWLNATYSYAVTFLALEFLAVIAASSALREYIPTDFNPIYSKSIWMPVAFMLAGVATQFAIDRATRKFKYDVSDANQYMRSWDLVMWALPLAIVVSSTVISALLIKGAWNR